MIPWPMGGVVRSLLRMHSPENSDKLLWESVYLQPSSGLYFNGLTLNATSRLSIHAPQAFVRFSWSDLMMLETKIQVVQFQILEVQWDVAPNTPDGSLDFASPTESHVAQLKSVLDSLAPVIDESGVQLHAKQMLLLMALDTLSLEHASVSIQQKKNSWGVHLKSGPARRGAWPLPEELLASLSLSDTSMQVSSLQACWNGGCLEGEGKLGMGKKNSQMEFDLQGIPLRPFGVFALPDQADWRGKAVGQFQWEGRIAHPNSWKAQGEVEFCNMIFVQWPFQRESTFSNFVPSLSQVMEIDQVQIPAFTLQNGKVRIDSLTGSGDDLEFTGKGAWTFPQRLDFHLKGTIDGDLYESLPRLTKLALKKEDAGGGFRASLSGTFMWQALVPGSEHYGTALRNLFR